jgi:hypothetical protein
MRTREEVDRIARDALAARIDENGYPIEEFETVETITLDFIESSGNQGVTFVRLAAAFSRALKDRGTPLPLT